MKDVNEKVNEAILEMAMYHRLNNSNILAKLLLLLRNNDYFFIPPLYTFLTNSS